MPEQVLASFPDAHDAIDPCKQPRILKRLDIVNGGQEVPLFGVACCG
jgi:hypothetical protein